MKAARRRSVLVVLGMLGAIPAAPSHASDQALQAILQKMQCVPAKVARTVLAAEVVTYEVTCIGRADIVYIECRGGDCWQQTKSPNLDSDPPS